MLRSLFRFIGGLLSRERQLPLRQVIEFLVPSFRHPGALPYFIGPTFNVPFGWLPPHEGLRENMLHRNRHKLPTISVGDYSGLDGCAGARMYVFGHQLAKNGYRHFPGFCQVRHINTCVVFVDLIAAPKMDVKLCHAICLTTGKGD
jgi:hypothetical protein